VSSRAAPAAANPPRPGKSARECTPCVPRGLMGPAKMQVSTGLVSIIVGGTDPEIPDSVWLPAHSPPPPTTALPITHAAAAGLHQLPGLARQLSSVVRRRPACSPRFCCAAAADGPRAAGWPTGGRSVRLTTTRPSATLTHSSTPSVPPPQPHGRLSAPAASRPMRCRALTHHTQRDGSWVPSLSRCALADTAMALACLRLASRRVPAPLHPQAHIDAAVGAEAHDRGPARRTSKCSWTMLHDP